MENFLNQNAHLVIIQRKNILCFCLSILVVLKKQVYFHLKVKVT